MQQDIGNPIPIPAGTTTDDVDVYARLMFRNSESAQVLIDALNRVVKTTIQPSQPKLVYICSPCRGNVSENLNRTQMYSTLALSRGYTPIAPHLMYRDLLSDNKPKERERALAIGLQLLSLCREIWVFGDTISEGMQGEIDYATKHNIKIVYKHMLG